VKALFGKSSLNKNTSLTSQLKRTMDLLTINEIKHTDNEVLFKQKHIPNESTQENNGPFDY